MKDWKPIAGSRRAVNDLNKIESNEMPLLFSILSEVPDFVNQRLNDSRVRQCGDITERISLLRRNLSQDAAHNLA